MKKKTLMILLGIVIATMAVIIIKNIYYFAFELSLFDIKDNCFSSGKHTHEYNGFTINCTEYRAIIFNQVVSPLLSFLFHTAVEILLIVIMIALVKREHLILTNEDISKLEADRKTKQKAKQSRRIMQLNAKSKN